MPRVSSRRRRRQVVAPGFTRGSRAATTPFPREPAKRATENPCRTLSSRGTLRPGLFHGAAGIMNHSYSSNIHHIVFATKGRRRWIDPALESRLFPYLGGICRNLNGALIRVNGDADHLHLLASLPSTISPAEAAGKIKGNSSRWIHETFPERKVFSWQRGYGAFSVSRSNVPKVSAYIDRQKEHHRRWSFEREFEELLRLHGVEFERQYLWR